MLKYLLVGVLALTVTSSHAGELNWSFKSPAFHYGNGYSNHVLSVEQLQYQRRKEMEDEARPSKC